MADIVIPYSFAAGQVIAADQQNDNYDEIESKFNASIASVLADSSTAGRIVVVSNSGAPAYVAMSGDATISDTGALTIAADAVTPDKVQPALLEKIGVSETSTVRRGKSAIATAEGTALSTYAALATPDRVADVVLPTDGLIFVLYRALIKASAGGTLSDAIAVFVDGVQSKAPKVNGAPAVVGDSLTLDTFYGPVLTTGDGFATIASGSSDSSVSSDAVTWAGSLSGANPASLWQPIVLEAPAGTYDIDVRFKSAGGVTVTAKERKLRVWTMGFG